MKSKASVAKEKLGCRSKAAIQAQSAFTQAGSFCPFDFLPSLP
jgi:hypothetical protein